MMEPTYSSGGNNTMVWIVVIAIAVFFIWKGGDLDLGGRESGLDDTDSTTFSRGTTDSEVINDNTELEETTEQQEQTTTVDTNACGYELFGYPNYDGTTKEGDTCADAFPGEEDNECLDSPPSQYDGYINTLKGTSNPELTCCLEDGTCQWVE